MRTEKLYRCKRCGCLSKQVTNHFGPTWSWGHFNCCPSCPPWAKYSEFGGSTVWEYVAGPFLPILGQEESNGVLPHEPRQRASEGLPGASAGL